MLAHQDQAVTHRLMGELHDAAAARVAVGDGTDEKRKAAAAPYLRVVRDALALARRLTPKSMNIVAAALGDTFAASPMFEEAEAEYIPRPSDPALHNAAYAMFEGYEEHELDPDFASERVEEARSRAATSYARTTVEEAVPLEIEPVGRQRGAAEGRKAAKRVAETFPKLGRAQYVVAYMDLEFVRSLDGDAAIDNRPFLRRTLLIAERVARDYPKSLVVASFHAKLLFVLVDYDATEAECRGALQPKDPDDPQQDCIPIGSISGENRGARLVSLAYEFHELINNILMLANDYWGSMSSERQRHCFQQVRLVVLQDEYCMVDRSCAFTMSDVRSFVDWNKSGRFWICPLCDRKKFMDTGSLLSHMCSRQPRAVRLPRLQSALDQKPSDEASESDDSVDGVTLCEDSKKQQDMMICLNKSSEVFKWLFYAPSSGVRPRPFPEIRMLLESIKDKMKTLPTDRSSTEFAKAIPEIQDTWHRFLIYSVLDYRGIILELARSFLWRELRKCMTEEFGAKSISAADIDAIFTKEVNPASNDVEPSQMEETPNVSAIVQESCRNVHDEGESSENQKKNTELSNQASMAETEIDLAAKLDKLEIDPKISESNQESVVHVEHTVKRLTQSSGKCCQVSLATRRREGVTLTQSWRSCRLIKALTARLPLLMLAQVAETVAKKIPVRSMAGEK